MKTKLTSHAESANAAENVARKMTGAQSEDCPLFSLRQSPDGTYTSTQAPREERLSTPDIEVLVDIAQRRHRKGQPQFEELYAAHDLELSPLAVPPLGTIKEKRPVPRHLITILTVLAFLVVGTTTSFAVDPFRKTLPQQALGEGIIAELDHLPKPEAVTEPVREVPALPDAEPVEAEPDPDIAPPEPAEPERVRPRVRRPARQATAQTGTTTPPTPRPTAQQPGLGVGTAERRPIPEDAETARIREVLDNTLGTTERSREEAEAAALPAAPSRSQVLRSLRGVSGRVANCGRDSGGRVSVDVTIHGPTGSVSSARVTNGVDQVSSACVVRAVSNARFPRFSDPSFTVRNFPFTVR